MEDPLRARFEIRRPLDLALTISPIGQGAWLRLDGTEAWRATLTPEGPASVHLKLNNGAVDVEAWGPGAAWAAAGAGALCGEEDDDAGFRPALRAARMITSARRRSTPNR